MENLTTQNRGGQTSDVRSRDSILQRSRSGFSEISVNLNVSTLDEIGDVADPICLSDRTDAKDLIRRFTVTLSPREERILRLRFGLGGIGEHTLEEIGELFGVGRGRIRQIEQKALRKLRQKARQTWPTRAFPIRDLPARSCNREVTRRTSKPVVKTPLVERKPPLQNNKAEGFDAADARRTRLYREWQADRDAALAKSRTIETETQKGNSGLLKPLLGIACAMLTLIFLLAWGYTLGESGKVAFNSNFGRQDGPIVRLLVWLAGMVGAPLFAHFATSAFRGWFERHRLAFR